MPTGDAYSSGHLVPSLWDLHIFYLLRPILFRTCRYFTGLCSSNIPRYFLDFALNRGDQIQPPEIDFDNNIEELDISVEEISVEEIQAAIRKMKNNKAAGVDNIPAGLLKADIEATSTVIHGLFQDIWRSNLVPTEWKSGLIIKLSKKEDTAVCNNWRGITLLPVISKVFNGVLLQRVKQQVIVQLRKEQAGFRPGRSCCDQISVLRNIIEQSTS